MYRSDTNKDLFDMPQPTFEVALSEEDRTAQSAVMSDMQRAAAVLGGYLPTSPPQWMVPGIAQHMTGVTRMGDVDDAGATSVVDTYSRAWGIGNLFLGGNGVIPRAVACNPT